MTSTEPAPADTGSTLDPTTTTRRGGLTRRRALGGAAGIGVALPVLAACGGEEEAASDPAADLPAGASLTPTADVPVGGGAILSEEEVVVTQPTEGEFKAFSAVCTHQGCLVSQVSADGIVCTCHGSVFALDTGEPTDGPATEALAAVAVTVSGDEVTLA
ncbi:Rieske (2Fe-2S) protein [Nocardioides sp. Leaf285]|uniref:Rieske (2Fe-2S) protein n=1 Tax=Nocardioides sp. Leaf285 TaxID=1736322 RepID=UPI0009E9A2AA|nr:Rieske (2Fe-2S) protein [Nocardioides sp. Leaf285]